MGIASTPCSSRPAGYLQNVSKSGVFVRSEEIPVRGETVKLTFARSFGDWVTVQGEAR